jgi:hypothetical protein
MTESPQHAAWRNRPTHEKHLSFAEWLRNSPGRAAGSPVAPASLRSTAKARLPPQRPRSKAPKKKSPGEEGLALALHVNGIEFEREYEFAKPRKYRADFYILPNLLIEVEGGTWSNGRHSRGSGMEEDMKKYNLATKLGFSLLRYSTAMVKSGDAIRDIMGLLP